jgi:hypothetical protein
MGRATALALALLLVLAACGGGDGEAGEGFTEAASDQSAGDQQASDQPTSSEAATETTRQPAVTVGDDFCEFVISYAEGIDAMSFGLNPAAFETALTENLAAMEQAASIAPSEVRGDAERFVTAYGGFVEFLEEYDWNVIAISEASLDDPRLLALEDPELVAAGNRISEYCGVDDLIAVGPSGFGDRPGVPGGSQGGPAGGLEAGLPDGFPDDLAPPGGAVVAAFTSGGIATVSFDVPGDAAETVSYYTDLLGSPELEALTPRSAVWSTSFEGTALQLTVVEVAPGMAQVTIVLS